MNLFDKLSSEDKELIENYLCTYTSIDYLPSLEKTLGYWTKNKKTMYKLLGNQFSITIPFELDVNIADMAYKMYNIYPLPINLLECYNNYSVHPFVMLVSTYLNKLIKKGWDKDYIKRIAGILREAMNYSRLLKGEAFYSDVYIEAKDIIINDKIVKKIKPIKFSHNTKNFKAIRKILEIIDFSEMDCFKTYRDDMTRLMTNKKYSYNVTLSIHPIDFFTMSHNNSNWTSCMDWAGGGNSNGVIEMLNSNMVIVAYIESKEKFTFKKKYNLPNKTWRQLFYVHKDIICSGKSYPYNNTDLTRAILDKIAELAYKNLKWKYQYKNQRYYDDCNFHSNRACRNIDNHHILGHKIYLYTYAAMYNDLIEDKFSEYWCYRNYVPCNKYICVSGPATCIICGKEITSIDKIRYADECDEDDWSIMSHGNKKTCWKCQSKFLIDSFIFHSSTRVASYTYCIKTPIYEFATFHMRRSAFNNTISGFITHGKSTKERILSENGLYVLKPEYYLHSYRPELVFKSKIDDMIVVKDDTAYYTNEFKSSKNCLLIFDDLDFNLLTEKERSYFKPVEESDFEQLQPINSFSL